MKKSFYISLSLLLFLFLSTVLGFANDRKNTIPKDSLQNKMGLKSAESVQHGTLLLASIAENDLDVDKTFFDLSFTLFVKQILSLGFNPGANVITNSISESVHHYHLPKYLLFHNLKIRL